MLSEVLWKIWKYQFEIDDEITIEVPMDSVLLDIQVQNGVPTMWYQVTNYKVATSTHKFRIFGTGNPTNCHEPIEYRRTIQMGNFVWHIYEIVWPETGSSSY